MKVISSTLPRVWMRVWWERWGWGRCLEGVDDRLRTRHTSKQRHQVRFRRHRNIDRWTLR